MVITEIRLANFLVLLEQAGTLERLADKTDSNPTHFSQLKSGNRNIGHRLARRIELKHGLPEGWMDIPRDGLLAQAEALMPLIPEERRADVLKTVLAVIRASVPLSVESE